MTAKQTFYLMCAFVILLGAGLVGGAYGTQVLLKKESNKMVGLKTQVDLLTSEQTSLKIAQKQITDDTDLYNISKVIVPQNKDQAQAVRQIVNLANTNNVVLDSINFPASNLGTGVIGSNTATPSAGTSATTGRPALSQLTAVPKVPGVYSLQLTVNSSPQQPATFDELIGFLSALEQNRQTALVSSIDIQPNSANHRLFSFSLVLNIYIKP